MAAPPADTHPAIESLLIAGYRKMSAAEKFRQVESLNETVLQFAATRIRREHAGLTDRELRLRLAELWLPSETLRRAFGWKPETRR